MGRYHAILFDMDGTLLDTLTDMQDAVNHVLAAHGLPLRTLEEVRCFVGNGAGPLIHRALPEGYPQEQKVLAEYRAYYQAHNCVQTCPYPGIPELLEQLRQRGVASTQATISRDIKQLHLVKEPTGHGTYKYAVSSSRARLNIADKLRTIFHESITSVDCAQNIVVFKTLAGLAGGACEALDHMDVNGMVGTLAGENTVFVVMKDNACAETFCQEIREML